MEPPLVIHNDAELVAAIARAQELAQFPEDRARQRELNEIGRAIDDYA